MFHSFRASSSPISISVTIGDGPGGCHPWVSLRLDTYTGTLVSYIDSLTEVFLYECTVI